MRYTVSRVFEKTRRRLPYKFGLTYEDALKYRSDPENSSRTCTAPSAIDFTDRNGFWFDIVEPEPWWSRLLSRLR